MYEMLLRGEGCKKTSARLIMQSGGAKSNVLFVLNEV